MRPPYGYVVYIDEAGDDGIGHFHAPGAPGQSHWLVLSACIIDAANEGKVVGWRDEIMAAFPKRRRRDIHFRSLDHNQRVHATHIVAEKQLGAIAILSNKQTIQSYPTFVEACRNEKNVLYKYLLRYVIERITEAAKRSFELRQSGSPIIKIIFSRRGGMDYGDFREYMLHLKEIQQSRGSFYPVHWEHSDCDLIFAEDHSRVAGLQLADIVASSFFQAVETNIYGHTESRYALALMPRVIQSTKGERLYCGIRPVPGLGAMVLTPQQRQFFAHWKKKRQAPGP
jgi:hypothetical protein